MTYTVLEQCCIGKQDDPATCEDCIYVGGHLVAVVDGATAKSDIRWDGGTSGWFAARQVALALHHVGPNATAVEAIERISEALYAACVASGRERLIRESPQTRPTAVMAAVNVHRRELWLVGDCQALIDGHRQPDGSKRIDEVNADARALFLEGELLRGRTIAELLEDDTGRTYILPNLRNQSLFQNRPETGEFWYPALDGLPVPPEGIRVHPLPSSACEVVIATDGYPVLRPTLIETEAELARLLQEDPLCFRQNRSTKGLTKGNRSFDDRAYLRLQLAALPSAGLPA